MFPQSPWTELPDHPNASGSDHTLHRLGARFSLKEFLFLICPPFKRTKTPVLEASTNNGLHMHGIILANRWGRLKDPLDLHFLDKRTTYVAGKIRSIDVVMIKDRPQYTTDYGGKGLKRRCFNPDHILILPRTLSELADPRFPGAISPQMREPLFWASFECRVPE